MKLKGVYQHNTSDCGIACLLSIIRYYKGNNTFENIRYLTRCDSRGISALNLLNASIKLGFKGRAIKIDISDLNKIVMPAIAHVTLNNGYKHFIVITKVDKNNIHVFDPATGKKKYKKEEFIIIWKGVAIELVPARKLDIINNEKIDIFKKIIIQNKKIYIILFLFSFTSILLAILNNYYFKLLIDKYNTIFLLLTFIIIVVLKEINDFIRNLFTIKLENNIDKFLNIETHNKLMSLPYYYFNSRTTGDIVTKMYDLDYIKELFIQVPLFLSVDLVLLIISSFILINISKNLFIIFLIICVLYMTVVLIFNKKTKELIRLNQEFNAFNNDVLVDNIKGINTIKNFNILKYRNQVYKNTYETLIKNKISYEKTYSTENLIKNTILFIGINLILYLGILSVNNNYMELSDLVLFNSLMLYFIEPLKNICDLNPVLKNGINAIKRIKEIYAIKLVKTPKRELNNHDIEFKNLTYSYDGYRNVLDNFNWFIKSGDKIVVTGPSGCGKSTLFKLLNKTYEVDKNMIFINNFDINEINVEDYITYISQEEKLFNDTLYNNITLGQNIYDDKINEVMKITRLNEVMVNKKIDMNSIINEEGINFSKGERQKIILTRVLLRKTKIIILDEALCGLEEDEEIKILQDILVYYKNNTIIYITHSTKTIELFQRNMNLKEVI